MVMAVLVILFIYLKTYLDKSVLQAIEGFSLLDEKYGNEQLIVSCHMNNLIKLVLVVWPSVNEMSNLHDTIESNVHALRSLGINYEHFRPLLVPFILEKLPNTIKLQISRKLGKEKWKKEEFL